ncbi:MAG: LytTR family DNA-binding domain-containing protein, partial [Cyanobacteria bacterium J06649_11]
MSHPRINVCIVEDEQKYIDEITLLLSKLEQDFDIVATFTSLDRAMKEIPSLSFDLLFLDVELRPGHGFDLLKYLSESGINFKVIFVTAYEKYAVKAFKFSAFDFLLKPLQLDELKEAMGKFTESFWIKKEYLEKAELLELIETQNKKWESLKGKMQRLEASQQPFPIPVKDGIELVMVDDIVRCEAQVNQTDIHLKGERLFRLVNYTLKELDIRLSPYGFLRVHQSHLVNLKYVKKWNRLERLLILKNKTFISVSQA